MHATAPSWSRCRTANSPAGSSAPNGRLPHGRATSSSSSITIRAPSSVSFPMLERSRKPMPCRQRALALRESTMLPVTPTSSTAMLPTASWNRSSRERFSPCRRCSFLARASTRARKPKSPPSSRAKKRASSKLAAIGNLSPERRRRAPRTRRPAPTLVGKHCHRGISPMKEGGCPFSHSAAGRCTMMERVPQSIAASTEPPMRLQRFATIARPSPDPPPERESSAR